MKRVLTAALLLLTIPAAAHKFVDAFTANTADIDSLVLTDPLPYAEGGIGDATGAAALRVLRINGAGTGLEFVDQGAGHSQNTDTGTDQASFGVNSDAGTAHPFFYATDSGGLLHLIKWNETSGRWTLRNDDDSDYEPFQASAFYGAATGLTAIPAGQLTGAIAAINGAALTALNASNLGSGTVPDARFPATIPAASGVNLTALNASNLASGTIPGGRFPATLPAANGSLLTSLNASQLATGTIPNGRFPSTLPAASGENLTDLNASFLETGTVDDVRLSAAAQAIIAGGTAVDVLITNTDNTAGSTGFATWDFDDVLHSIVFSYTENQWKFFKTGDIRDNIEVGDVDAQAGSFTTVAGAGSGITALNASNLASGTVPEARLPTAIDAAKIADGSVSNTEFQYIGTLASNAQTQIDGKAGLTSANTFTAAQTLPAKYTACVKDGGDTVAVGDGVEIYGWDGTALKPKVRRLTSVTFRSVGVAAAVSSNNITVCTEGVCDMTVIDSSVAGILFSDLTDKHYGSNSDHLQAHEVIFGTLLEANSSGSPALRKVYVQPTLSYSP
jgi:hypothetical protein